MTLSDKIQDLTGGNMFNVLESWDGAIHPEDVKEFIKELKKSLVIPDGTWKKNLEKHFLLQFDFKYSNGQSKQGLIAGLEFAEKIIDKLAGEKLIK